jgi:DNA-directed RNA polymerase specialized sigma24 family protein
MSTLPVDVMESDWQREQHSPLLRSQFACWREAEPALARFRTPGEAVRFLHSGLPARATDPVLLALLARARDDPLAGRVVLQGIRPGLKRLAGRILVDAREREQLWALVFEVAWERIRGYPVERRRVRVASNLLLDTLHKTVDELERRPREGLLPVRQADGDVEALLKRAVEAGAISDKDAQLILRSRIDRVDLALLARAAGVPYNTIKLRRQRAERRLLVFFGHRPVPRGHQKGPSYGCSGRSARSTGPVWRARPTNP